MSQNQIVLDIESAQIWKIANSVSLIWIFQFQSPDFTLIVVSNYADFTVGLTQYNLIWSYDSSWWLLFFILMQAWGLTFQGAHLMRSQHLIFEGWLFWTLTRNDLKAYFGSGPGCSTLSYLPISWLILEWWNPICWIRIFYINDFVFGIFIISPNPIYSHHIP